METKNWSWIWNIFGAITGLFLLFYDTIFTKKWMWKIIYQVSASWTMDTTGIYSPVLCRRHQCSSTTCCTTAELCLSLGGRGLPLTADLARPTPWLWQSRSLWNRAGRRSGSGCSRAKEKRFFISFCVKVSASFLEVTDCFRPIPIQAVSSKPDRSTNWAKKSIFMKHLNELSEFNMATSYFLSHVHFKK